MNKKSCFICNQGEICQCSVPKNLIFSKYLNFDQIVLNKACKKEGRRVKIAFDKDKALYFLIFESDDSQILLEIIDKDPIIWVAYDHESVEGLSEILDQIDIIDIEDDALFIEFEAFHFSIPIAFNEKIKQQLFS